MIPKQYKLIDERCPLTKLLSLPGMPLSFHSSSSPPGVVGLLGCHFGQFTVMFLLCSESAHFIDLHGSIAIMKPHAALLLRQVPQLIGHPIWISS